MSKWPDFVVLNFFVSVLPFSFFKQKNAAYERYETAIQEILVNEKHAQAKAEELAAKEKDAILHQVATN